MLFSYKSSEKTVVVLNDLIKINNDRIACYEQALNNGENLDIDLKILFGQLIKEASRCKTELLDKARELEHNPRNSTTITGLVYRAWMDLKVSLTGNTRKSILNFCLYNEEIAQHAYQAAQNLAEKIDDDVRKIIGRHQGALKDSYDLIKSYKEARHYSTSGLMYFN